MPAWMRPPGVQRHGQHRGDVGEARGAEVQCVPFGPLAAEQRREHEPRKAIGGGFVAAKSCRAPLRIDRHDVRTATQQFRGLTRPDRQGFSLRSGGVQRGPGARGAGGERREPVLGRRDQRSQRRARGLRGRKLGSCAIDVEVARLAGRATQFGQAQCLALRRDQRVDDRHTRLRPAQGPVLACDLGDHRQLRAALSLLCRQPIGVGGVACGARRAEQIDLPGHVERGAARVDVRQARAHRGVIAGFGARPDSDGVDRRQQPRRRGIGAGARLLDPGQCDAHVVIGGERRVDQLVEHWIAPARPPAAFIDRSGAVGIEERRLARQARRCGRRSRRRRGAAAQRRDPDRRKCRRAAAQMTGQIDSHGHFIYCTIEFIKGV